MPKVKIILSLVRRKLQTVMQNHQRFQGNPYRFLKLVSHNRIILRSQRIWEFKIANQTWGKGLIHLYQSPFEMKNHILLT